MIEAPPRIDYGIQTEDSDIRAHVSVVNHVIYVFPTTAGLTAIEKFNPPQRNAYQRDVIGATARGWLVRPEWIEDLCTISLDDWPDWDRFKPSMSTSAKGKLAVKCVIESMRRGKFPLRIETTEVGEPKVQISGTDIIVSVNKRVQVKCDYYAGHEPKGTGNLFLQSAESNPLQRY